MYLQEGFFCLSCRSCFGKEACLVTQLLAASY